MALDALPRDYKISCCYQGRGKWRKVGGATGVWGRRRRSCGFNKIAFLCMMPAQKTT